MASADRIGARASVSGEVAQIADPLPQGLGLNLGKAFAWGSVANHQRTPWANESAHLIFVAMAWHLSHSGTRSLAWVSLASGY